jgi:PAS domain S-box-containing protein
MREPNVRPTGVERFFPEDGLIVSKTDLKGRITYANRTFIEISGFSEEELLGQPHSIIRHPEMPRCVFKLLWDALQSAREIFAYVNNMSRNGDHYWVFAHVTPTFNQHGQVIAYHSNRRVPGRSEVELFSGLYEQLLREERKHADWRAGMEASMRLLTATLAGKDLTYDQFVLSV